MKTQTITHQPTPLDTLLTARDPTDTALIPPTGAPAAPLAHTQTPDCFFNYPTIHSSNHPSHIRKPRNGKIARLPKPVRDVVNRMLFLNVPQERIVGALDELGIKVSQPNISNWKTRGGYREWCLAQEHATTLRIYQDNLLDLMRRHDAPELPEIGLQAAATQLSSFFLTPEARQLLASDPKEYERRVSMLARISTHLKASQQSRDDSAKALGRDHDPDRIRNETDSSLQRVTETYTSELGESPRDPDIPHRNLLPNPAELFNFTDRAPADESREDSLLEWMKAFCQRSSAPKPELPNPPAANETTAPNPGFHDRDDECP